MVNLKKALNYSSSRRLRKRHIQRRSIFR